jgi:hypothetical protein
MYIFWQQIFRLPQTFFLIAGIGIGYLSFMILLGMRPLVLTVGGAIALAMISIWLWQTRNIAPSTSISRENLSNQDNLLNREVFLLQLSTLKPGSSKQAQSHWQKAYHWAESSHTCAIAIADQEPTLIPDLLAALHTILALSKRVADELQAMDRIKTPAYIEVAKRRIIESCDRLKSSYEQLQSLHDQTLLLKSGGSQADLPQQIQYLIEANQTALE